MPLSAEPLPQRLGVLDYRLRVGLAELHHLQQAHRQRRDPVPVDVVDYPGVDLRADALEDLLVVAQDQPSLRPREALVGGAEEQRAPLAQRVLELASREQAHDVRAVVDADRVAVHHAGNLADWLRERDEARAEDEELGLLQLQKVPGRLGVDVEGLLVEREVEVLQPQYLPQPHVRDAGVPPALEADRDDLVAPVHQGQEDRDVRGVP